MKNRVKDITNKKFGRLLAISHVGSQNNRAIWVCLCDCGNKIIVSGKSLRSGNTSSCGCYMRQVRRERMTGRLVLESTKQKIREARTSHGMRYTQIYRRWINMRIRCYNSKDISYKNYGGRGITVCERWKDSFKNFYEDMGNPPHSEMELDRIDNNKGYSKENCKWSTYFEQARNRRSTKLKANDVLEIKRLICLGDKDKEISDKFGVKFQTINKIRHGYSYSDVGSSA